MFRHDARHSGCFAEPQPLPPAPNFETYIVLQNPNAQTATVTLSYMMQGGATKDDTISVKPKSRSTVFVNDAVGYGKSVSTRIYSTLPIICERPMYFDYRGFSALNWTGGHDVMGAAAPASTFYFAEGTCRPGFEPYLCIQNPGASQAAVKITYMKGDGSTQVQWVAVPAHTRSTVVVKKALGEGNDPAHDFSCKVETASKAGIICERSLYFNYKGTWTGGHDAIGAQAPSQTWYFAEGCTGS
jgi:hypothetical protein